MRKIYLFLSLSLDGYFEGSNHDLSWHNVDDEVIKFAIQQLKETDLYLWGRRIYQNMEAVWPKMAVDPSASKDSLEIARLLNNTPKIVFSRTLKSVKETKNWKNVELVRELDLEGIRRLKRQAGKDIGVGGPNLALALVKAGLVDEFRFMMVPVLIGRGTSISEGMLGKTELEFVKTRRFDSGNLLLYYRPNSA